MWHEARRQERKIRGMLVDYRRRAERRRDFYEKIKADPTQFLQVHGRQCKIHLDPTIAAAADAAVMMPWQGHSDNLIDRFDVRAHLDIIPNPPRRKKGDDGDEDLVDDDGGGGDEEEEEERHLNYERYRIIAQNSFLGVSEEKFLRQLHLEEQFGYANEGKGKRSSGGGGGGVAIGYSYDEGSSGGATGGDQHHESEGEDSDSDLDVDLAINVSKMDPAQAHEMNAHGRRFGMSSNDFYSFLTNDLEEWESYKLAKEEEQEKALFSGRRSRRERRYHREKRLANRKISPPSYAAQASPSLPNLRESKSASRSPSPENSGKITYITSFGDDEETPSSANTKPTYADKVKSSGRSSKIEDKRGNRSRRSRSRSQRSRRRRSRSRSKSRRSKSRRRSRSRRSRSKRRSRSRSRKRFRRSRSRSGSRYKSYRRKRSTSSSSTSSSSSRKSFISPPGTTPQELPRRSPVKVKEEEKSLPVDVPKVIPRYYGRKKSDYSSSGLTSDSDGTEEAKHPTYKTLLNDSKSGNGNSSGTSTKYKAFSTTSPSAMNTINVATTSSSNMTVIERLKRKRQALLNRQFKADKMAEQLKTEREKQEQQTREDELREMAIRIRRRQRELRHAYDSRTSSSSRSSSSDSSSSSSSRASNSAKQVLNSSKHTSYSSRRSRSRERSRNSREPERRSTIGPRDRRRDEEKSGERREKRLVDY